MTRSELAKAIKASRLHKLYDHPTGEVSREAPSGVNATGQATDRLMELQRRIKQATMRETDWPPELRGDADELRGLVQTAIVTLFADSENGEIAAADFKALHDPLADMTEGLLAALNHDDPDAMMSLRSMKAECADKAFYSQLRKVLREGASGRERMFQLGKALSSFATHLFIRAEKGGHLPTGLVEEVGGLVGSINAKAARGVFEFADELAKVRAWGLVEGEDKGIVTRAKVKGPRDDDTDYAPGGEEKVEVVPPGLEVAPDHPKDVKPGKEPRQQGGGYAGLKATVDGVKAEVPPKQPKVEHVEFLVRIPRNPGQMEWNVRAAGKPVGEAWRRVFLGGGDHHARIDVGAMFEKLTEGTAYASGTLTVDAPDIFGLQTKVVEELNRAAAELKVGRRFRLER